MSRSILRFDWVLVFSLVLAAGQRSAIADVPVRVVLDLDAYTPGIQSNVFVSAGATDLSDVAVYIVDPLGSRLLFGIGYVGGIDRGISLGHTPRNENQGRVTRMTGSPVQAANPANSGEVLPDGVIIKMFAGPELQYLEFGAAHPAPIPSAPALPVLRATLRFENLRVGDIFDFHLLDVVSVWRNGMSGAFSTTGGLSLDTGGDAVPDGTRTLFGVDPDTAVPIPPAAYAVDYVDGPNSGGAATVRVVPLGDLNCDGQLDNFDIDPFVLAISDPSSYHASYPGCDIRGADLNHDGAVNNFDVDPFVDCLAAGQCL